MAGEVKKLREDAMYGIGYVYGAIARKPVAEIATTVKKLAEGSTFSEAAGSGLVAGMEECEKTANYCRENTDDILKTVGTAAAIARFFMGLGG